MQSGWYLERVRRSDSGDTILKYLQRSGWQPTLQWKPDKHRVLSKASNMRAWSVMRFFSPQGVSAHICRAGNVLVMLHEHRGFVNPLLPESVSMQWLLQQEGVVVWWHPVPWHLCSINKFHYCPASPPHSSHSALASVTPKAESIYFNKGNTGNILVGSATITTWQVRVASYLSIAPKVLLSVCTSVRNGTTHPITKVTMMGKVWGAMGVVMKILVLSQRHFKLRFYCKSSYALDPSWSGTAIPLDLWKHHVPEYNCTAKANLHCCELCWPIHSSGSRGLLMRLVLLLLAS